MRPPSGRFPYRKSRADTPKNHHAQRRNRKWRRVGQHGSQAVLQVLQPQPEAAATGAGAAATGAGAAALAGNTPVAATGGIGMAAATIVVPHGLHGVQHGGVWCRNT
jgi:hypothetical protein